MKHIKITQARFIQGTDGFDTAAEFNEAMNELSGLNPKWERDGNAFWIFYTVTRTEAEDIFDEYELKTGEIKRCEDCPYIIRELNRFGRVDGVKKYGTCGKSGQRTRIDCRACESYYRELMKGGSLEEQKDTQGDD